MLVPLSYRSNRDGINIDQFLIGRFYGLKKVDMTPSSSLERKLEIPVELLSMIASECRGYPVLLPA